MSHIKQYGHRVEEIMDLVESMIWKESRHNELWRQYYSKNILTQETCPFYSEFLLAQRDLVNVVKVAKDHALEYHCYSAADSAGAQAIIPSWPSSLSHKLNLKVVDE